MLREVHFAAPREPRVPAAWVAARALARRSAMGLRPTLAPTLPQQARLAVGSGTGGWGQRRSAWWQPGSRYRHARGWGWVFECNRRNVRGLEEYRHREEQLCELAGRGVATQE